MRRWKVLAITLLSLCFLKSGAEISSAEAFSSEQLTLDIENNSPSEVHMDAIYGKWEITEYIGSALANPGISSVIPREHGRTNELGTIVEIGEDYFKYGDLEKEDIILFCNILPLSCPPEQICFLPCGISMNELGVEGDYFIYLYVEGTEGYVQIILQDRTHLIFSYMQELYLCERIYEPDESRTGGFMEVSIVDCQTSYCSLYEHVWKIVKTVPYQEEEGRPMLEDKEKTGETVEFSYGSEGRIWVTTNSGDRIRVNARISFINNTYEKGIIYGYGTFDELGLEGNFITYISFDETKKAEWLQGLFIISEDRILLHGDKVLYECERISEKIKPEKIRLF